MHFKYWIFGILAFFALFSGYVYSQSISVDDNSDNLGAGKLALKGLKFYTALEPAFGEAKARQMPLFVYARSEYCGWCKKFEEESFTNQSVIKALNENFVLVSIDVDEQTNQTWYFGVRGTPTSIFLDAEGREMKRVVGYVNNGTFLDVVNEAARMKNEA